MPLKGVPLPYCTSCGAQTDEGQAFCTVCGKALAAPSVTHEAMPYFQEESVKETGGYAGFWWRVLAYVIDIIILAIVAAIIDSAFSTSTAGRGALAAALAFIYGTAFIATSSRTLGMMVARMHVESVDGAKIGWSQAAIRSGFYAVLLFVSDLYHVKTYAHPTQAQVRHELHHLSILLLISLPHILDNLWMLWNKRKQTWHDMIAKTVVKR
jgi:uncharacterized RDD family membrane protein YckC